MAYELFTAALGALIAVYAFLRALTYLTQDAQEPPVVDFPLPFLGALVGMAREKSKFYNRIRDRYGHPIYTLRLPGSRIYVINSTALIPVAQRQFKTVAFGPIEVRAAQNVMGASKQAVEIMSNSMIADHGYLPSFAKAIHPALSPGAQLDAMNNVSVQTIAASLDKLQVQPTRVKLFEWIRHEIFMATTDGVYGPQNPMRDASVEAAWYQFEPAIVLFLINLWPKVLARKAYQAREKVVHALSCYYRDGGHLKASALTKSRYDHNVDHHIPEEDIPRTEVGNIFAVIGNTGPATFWLIYHIYSDPVVLEVCRQEVSKIVQDDGNNGRILDITNVKTDCPTLLSTLQEVLRFHGTGISARVVLEDHMLDGRYLLKKGSTLMIPGPVQHTSGDVWGGNVDTFHHKRFLRSDQQKRPNPVAFRGFGGGTVLCPGRHFASTEILAFAALMIMRFDIRPTQSDAWTRPGTEKAAPSASVAPPDVDLEAELLPRGPQRWRVCVSASDAAMEIAAEDIKRVTK
ncbi:cytochrome P450 oxidoreductase [Xylariomycetidae sp. FL2044]|nr:cytochrome P450 oxidoreductase [Xylariomycetidae sp. FL2044]